MSLVVQKWGGSTLSSVNQLKRVASKIFSKQGAGDKVVVVVSAMEKRTDNLIDLAKSITDLPNLREYDSLISIGEQESSALLAIAINSLGGKARSLLGFQVPIMTDGAFKDARIEKIGTDVIKSLLKDGYIVVVAGFQGVDSSDNITTLGRGGTDNTAVAVAHALKADICEIYKDVNGVYTADPDIEPRAKRLDRISYEEVLEMASLGADVLQIHAVETAMRLDVPLHVLPDKGAGKGTFVVKGDKEMEKKAVSGVVMDRKESKITIYHIPDRPGVAKSIFKPLADENISVDLIIQNVSETGYTDLTFTVRHEYLARAKKITKQSAESLGSYGVVTDTKIAKVSVVGLGMRSHAGIAVRMFEALADGGINIQMISTSEIKISCVVDEDYGELAVRLLHKTFKLDKHGWGKKQGSKTRPKRKKETMDGKNNR